MSEPMGGISAISTDLKTMRANLLYEIQWLRDRSQGKTKQERQIMEVPISYLEGTIKMLDAIFDAHGIKVGVVNGN